MFNFNILQRLGLRSYPNYDKILQIEVSRVCNLKCKHCNRTFEYGLINTEIFENLIDTHKGMVDIAKLQGLGEPFLHPNIYQYANYASKNEYYVMTITNGTIPITNPEVFDKIMFSIDTLSYDSYKNMRGGNLDAVINNLVRCIELGSTDIEINCVQTKYNSIQEIEDLKMFCKRNDIALNVVPCEVWVDPLHKDYINLKKDALEGHENHHVTIIPDRKNYCKWGKTSFYYDYLGRSHPCCIRMTDDYIIDERDLDGCCTRCPI